jgi:hypothetical protein
MTYANALSALSKIGDPKRPDYEPKALEEWWLNSALAEYQTLGLLPTPQLEHLRSLTWRLVARSAAMIAWAEGALYAHELPAFVRAAALIGSTARAEASDESDADWNILLADERLRPAPATWPDPLGMTLCALDANRSTPPYCQQLSLRDRQVRHYLNFDGLIDAFVDASRWQPEDAPQYQRSPRGPDGVAGERLRAFAARELLRTPSAPEAAHPRHGLAAPVLTASAPLDGPESSVDAWRDCRERLRLDVEAKLIALAWLCQVGRKLRTFPEIKNPRKARHAAHGILASASQALLVLQEGRTDLLVPYWRTPLCLQSGSPEMPRLLAHAAYLVARARVEKELASRDIMDHLEQVVTIVERALTVVGPPPLGRGWLTQQELDGALQALRLGGDRASVCRDFCP